MKCGLNSNFTNFLTTTKEPNMAKLILKLAKQPGDPWITMLDSSKFTQEELDTVINPYFEYVRSLPGLQIQTPPPQAVFYDDTNESTMLFDTEQDAINARELLFIAPTDSRVIAKNTLMRSKLQAENVKYTLTVTIEP